jgi:hypothetical protein
VTAGRMRSSKIARAFYLGGIGWLLLSGLAFWAYFRGSAPFDTLGIPVSQLFLAMLFLWIGWRRSRHAEK